jgi:hypothetical protein
MINSDQRIPVRGVESLKKMLGESEEDDRLLKSMAVDAEKYLLSFSWCESIEDRYFGAGVGGIVAIFFFVIRPSEPNVDKWLWVITGDLPPAYLVVDGIRTPSEALKAYLWQRRRWIEAVRCGQSVSDLMPISVPATSEWASQLEQRLNYIEEHILDRFAEDEASS